MPLFYLSHLTVQTRAYIAAFINFIELSIFIIMAELAEYETLIRHTVDLQLTVRADLVSLGAQLVSAAIITPSQYQEIRNSCTSIDKRAADLIGYVQNKVHQNSQHYDTFIGVLMSDQSQYGDILAKLQETRRKGPQGM